MNHGFSHIGGFTSSSGAGPVERAVGAGPAKTCTNPHCKLQCQAWATLNDEWQEVRQLLYHWDRYDELVQYGVAEQLYRPLLAPGNIPHGFRVYFRLARAEQ